MRTSAVMFGRAKDSRTSVAKSSRSFGKAPRRPALVTASRNADGNTIVLPRYDIQASAGHGALVEHSDASGILTVSRNWLLKYTSNPGKVVVLEARGDSMEPTVRDGDLLLVDTGANADAISLGGVFVLTVTGMVMIKRLQTVLNGDLKILSDNSAYEHLLIPAGELSDKVIVHGRVVWSGGPLGRP